MDIYSYFVEILSPFLVTMFFTYLIGKDREKHGKAAGLKTHMLVAIGVCGIAIFQQHIYQDMITLVIEKESLSMSVKPENQRVIAQVITGIGFLGAGAIMKQNNKIEGLTTASTIWVVAMYSIIFGYGLYQLGFTLAIFSVFWIKFGRYL